MPQKTPLYERHRELGARLVDFGGWDMPLQYGSQIEEHHAVRRDAGMFDVSHMRVVDVSGPRAGSFLDRLLANDVGRLTTPGKALYSCMLNSTGGVIDDLIVYFQDAAHYRLVVNAGTADKDLAWIGEHADQEGVAVASRRDLAIVAVQGPNARAKVAALLPAADASRALDLEVFSSCPVPALGASAFIARTGYTGEDGFELIVDANDVVSLWRRLEAAGVRPCGLGARDTLRLEAGMNLYGNDMDETTTPLESGLAWTVALDGPREFIGRAALLAQRAAGVQRKLVGLLLEDKGVMRAHQKIVGAGAPGEVTSGTYSPTLERSIAFARVAASAAGHVDVDIRGKPLRARIVKPPFVRHGRALIAL
jgi:aminomethyltransferase